jgi:hypothetical protein
MNDCAQGDLARTALAAKARKKRQTLRVKKREAAQATKPVANSSYKTNLSGFSRGQKLPKHFDELINNLRRVVYSPGFAQSEGITYSRAKSVSKNLFEILVTMLTHSDLISGQIGKPKGNGMDTTSHDALMLIHAKRYGRAIASSTWYRCIEILTRAGILDGKEVKVYGRDGVTVRSKASYKWFSQRFLASIGTFKDHIKASIKLAYNKALASGLCFTWMQYYPFRKPRNNSAPLFSGLESPPPLH